jgi:polyisoprenoid-binding protein YceI
MHFFGLCCHLCVRHAGDAFFVWRIVKMFSSLKNLALTSVVTLAFTGTLALAAPAEYTIDEAHSTVGFEVTHLGISTVDGKFQKFSGKFQFDPEALDKTTLEASADTASIDTANKKRDDHLRSAEFFDASKNSKISFKSKRVEKIDDKKFKLIGDLTMKGITKEVPFEVSYIGAAKGGDGKMRAAFKANTTVNRFDFGLTWNNLVEAVPAVGKDVTIIIRGEGIKK